MRKLFLQFLTIFIASLVGTLFYRAIVVREIGLGKTTYEEKIAYELGYGKALDTLKVIMDQATKKEDQLKAITIVDLQDADTIYSYTLRRLDNKKFKK